MKPHQASDPLSDFIRQQVEQFDEIPSERVWEGLEARWRSPYLGRRTTLLVLLAVASVTLGISAMWLGPGWRLPGAGGEPLAPSLRVDCAEAAEDLLGEPAEPALAAQAPFPPVRAARPVVAPVPPSLGTMVSPPVAEPAGSPSLPAAAGPDTVGTGPETSGFLPSPQPVLRPKRVSHPGGPRRRRGHWDYQLALRVGTARFAHSFSDGLNRLTTNQQVEVLGEWVLHHRLRLQSGLMWERLAVEYGDTPWGPSEMAQAISFYGVAVDPAAVTGAQTLGRHQQWSIPVEALFYLTPSEKETQAWVGLGYRQSVYQLNRIGNRFLLADGGEVLGIKGQRQFSGADRAFLLRAGVEQRLTPALRVQLSGYYLRPLMPLHSSFFQKVGLSATLLWASPRGPMRWRKQRAAY